MDKYPKIPKGTKFFSKAEKILVFNPFAPAWFVTNKTGELILALCNGKRSIDRIVSLTKKQLGTDNNKYVKEFLIAADNSNIFYNDRDKQKVRFISSNLRILQMSLTSKCNLNCVYCYATAREEVGTRLLTLTDYKRIIDEATQISSNLEVVLTGGEPLLNDDWASIARYAKDQGCEVHLLSNGTLINSNNIKQIRDYVDLVIISIDASTQKLHEKLRGLNSYQAVEKGIAMLKGRGVNYNLSMTVSKTNINDVDAMSKKYGARLRFAPLFNAGSAQHSKQAISGNEYYQALSKVKGVNPLGNCESTLNYASQNRIHKCAIGDAEVSISETGDVYPCQLLHEAKFLAGNILNHSLLEIYNNSDVLKMCRHLTVDNIKGCSKCFLRYVCGGACRARAYHECGKLDVSGSFCEYEKQAYLDGIFNLYKKDISSLH